MGRVRRVVRRRLPIAFAASVALLALACNALLGNSDHEVASDASTDAVQPPDGSKPGRDVGEEPDTRTDSMPRDSGHEADVCTTTTVSGTVYDPAGALPLPNIIVFQPTGTLTPFVDGVFCDSCKSLASPSFATVVSANDGSFMLPIDIVGGTSNIQVVFQTGRWRREIKIPLVTPCMDNPIAAGTARLPKDRTEGDIPKTAIAMAGLESLECLLVKMGVSTSEIQPYQTSKDPARFQTFTNGTGEMTTTPLSPPMLPTLFDTATLGEYASVLLPCDGSTGTVATAAEAANLVAWSNLGGLSFIDHIPGEKLINGQLAATGWPATGTGPWTTGVDPAAPAQGKLLSGSPGPTALESWMALPAVAGTVTYGAPYFRVSTPRSDVSAVNAVTATEWARAESMNAWATDPTGNYTLTYSYDTPIGASKACGRVIFNDMHSATTRGALGGAFPSGCNTTLPLGEDEKVFEYMLFVSTACVGALP